MFTYLLTYLLKYVFAEIIGLVQLRPWPWPGLGVELTVLGLGIEDGVLALEPVGLVNIPVSAVRLLTIISSPSSLHDVPKNTAN